MSAEQSASRGTGFVALCYDSDSGERLRKEAMQAHMTHIEAVLGELSLAGPLYDESGTRAVGSLFVLRTGSYARAREIVESDPYYKAGVWRSVDYLPFLPAAGQYIGGKIW
jgi:hypothetical protein